MSDKSTFSAEDVVAGFWLTATFSPGAARAVATAINDAGPFGAMDPDDAGRAVQEAVYEATSEYGANGKRTAEGLRVSIDTCLRAVSTMQAHHAVRGFGRRADDGPSFGERMKAAKAAKSGGS